VAVHWDSPRLRFRILICCKGDWGTRLQENPQLILQLVVMIQLTSRRILVRGTLGEAPSHTAV